MRSTSISPRAMSPAYGFIETFKQRSRLGTNEVGRIAQASPLFGSPTLRPRAVSGATLPIGRMTHRLIMQGLLPLTLWCEPHDSACRKN